MTEPTKPEPNDSIESTPAASTEMPIAEQSTPASDTAGDGEFRRVSDFVEERETHNEAATDSDPLINALKQVIDPELMINIVDLGLIYEVEQTEATVNVDMTLTSPACPAGPQIMQQAKMALERLDDVDEAKIQLVMSPAWSPDRMTDDARDQLGIF